MKTKYILVSSGDASVHHVTVNIDPKYTEVEAHSQYAPEYFYKVAIDGNCNVILESYDGNGRKRISIPNGLVYDLLQAFAVLEKIGDKHAEGFSLFKEESAI